MKAAMDVGIIALVKITHSIQHGAGFVRRSGIVEIGQRLPVEALVQRRKIRPQFFQIIKNHVALISRTTVHASFAKNVLLSPSGVESGSSLGAMLGKKLTNSFSTAFGD
jgi:hypothetical protein